MAKDDLLMVEGKVFDLSGGGVYFITLENGTPVKARLCGKNEKNLILRLWLEIELQWDFPPYDPTHGLVTHRHKF